ncbi:MAG: hypothetical protein KKB50_10150 [Planctomycetes bacterium]|nr:hypothetical protein [Planctomycetota bacterium]
MRLIRDASVVGAFVLCALGSFMATHARQSQPAAQEAHRQPAGPTEVLGTWLRLLPEQIERISGVDPEFDDEKTLLEAALEAEREKLATMFEAVDATDEAILRQVETVIAVHDQLERRVAQHLLALRPHLTDEPRSKLFRRCADGIRAAGGHRWRHGQSEGWREGRGRQGRGGPPAGRGPGRSRDGGRGPNRDDSTDEAPTSRPDVGEQGDQP